MHVIHIMANNSSVPYFNWFAEEVHKHEDVKFSFIAMYPTKPQMLEDMKERGCDCYWVKYDDKKRKRGMVVAFFNLFQLFLKLKPDVVHCHLFDDSLPGLLAARIARIKKRIITKQDTTYHYYYAPKWVYLDRFSNFNATHIHAVADKNKEFIIDIEKAKSEKVHLIRNGFPFDKMTASRQEYIDEFKQKFKLNNRFVIGTVARLIEWKGHPLIIEAAKKLVEQYPNILFIWAGSGDSYYRQNVLEKKINEYGLNNHIIFADWIERTKIPSFYKCLNLYLHPAINEPFGFAISEALMNGIPIAATRTGSTDLVEHKINGFILKESSINSIIESVTYYIENAENASIIANRGCDLAKKNLLFNRMLMEHLALYANT